ncbi:uncharacterized protein LOC101762048 isoform X2 [Setaria italica]|uniref:Uncharacterized protein n=1 Tax=Setaria italica TaxID=4555 RepID=K3XM02_SETIT|nr:uncharacterized protein LOC101762048 isoform X2 [Setaria italica]
MAARAPRPKRRLQHRCATRRRSVRRSVDPLRRLPSAQEDGASPFVRAKSPHKAASHPPAEVRPCPLPTGGATSHAGGIPPPPTTHTGASLPRIRIEPAALLAEESDAATLPIAAAALLIPAAAGGRLLHQLLCTFSSHGKTVRATSSSSSKQGFRYWVPQEEEEEKKGSTEGFAGEGEEEENRGAQEGNPVNHDWPWNFSCNDLSINRF